MLHKERRVSQPSLRDKRDPKGLGHIVLFGGIHCRCIWETLCCICGVARWFDTSEQSKQTLGRHNGQRPLVHAVTQSNAKHCDVKCNQSVSNVIAIHRVHCGYIVHVFGIHW